MFTKIDWKLVEEDKCASGDSALDFKDTTHNKGRAGHNTCKNFNKWTENFWDIKNFEIISKNDENPRFTFDNGNQAVSEVRSYQSMYNFYTNKWNNDNTPLLNKLEQIKDSPTEKVFAALKILAKNGTSNQSVNRNNSSSNQSQDWDNKLTGVEKNALRNENKEDYQDESFAATK